MDDLDYNYIRNLEVQIYGKWFEMGGYPFDGEEYEKVAEGRDREWIKYLERTYG